MVFLIEALFLAMKDSQKITSFKRWLQNLIINAYRSLLDNELKNLKTSLMREHRIK